MDKRKLLFVEGVNDREVIYRIENANSLRGICEVEPSGSIDKVKTSFDIYINENASKVDVVGIVVDADKSIKNRWQSICDMIKETQNYDVPVDLPENGLIIEAKCPNKPKIGVWIMPDNKSNGMMEDFLLSLTKEDDMLLKFVDWTLDKLKQGGLQRFPEVHHSKARIHTYLSWQENPECTLAIALEKKYFNDNATLINDFADWMKQLFC